MAHHALHLHETRTLDQHAARLHAQAVKFGAKGVDGCVMPG
jgi:hypothetical protein